MSSSTPRVTDRCDSRGHSHRSRAIWIGLVSLACVSAPVASGQPTTTTSTTTPENEEEQIVTLSPFEVMTTAEAGYEVTETLAGSRIRTDLKDLGSSITVVTKDFMDDLGVSSLMELADFLPSMEQEIGSVSGEDGVNLVFRANSFRIRGLFTEAIGRNYFTNLVGEHNPPPDNFNADAVTLSAGANSILFGSANPAGIINTTTAKPGLTRDRYQVRHRTDNYGTVRLEGSVNKVLFKDVLAVHLAVLHEERNFFRDPQWLDQKRFYGAIAFRPFKKTRIDANVEYFDYARNTPVGTVMKEGFGRWIDAGRPTRPFSATTNPATVAGLRNASTAATTSIIFGSAGPMNPVQNWRNYAISAANSVGVTNVAPSLPLDFMDNTQNFLYDMRLDDRYGRIGDITISQEITPEFHMQLGAYSSYHRKDIWFNSDSQLMIDASETLPDGSANPNLGRYFVLPGSPNRNAFLYKDVTYRWTGAYELDLRDFKSWLGRHQIVALAEWREGIRTTDRARIMNTTPLPGRNASILNLQNRPQMVFYVDLDGGVRDTGQPLDLRDMGAYFATLDGITPEMLNFNFGVSTRTVQEAYLAGLQSHWFDDRLVTTFGYRIDTQDVWEHPGTAAIWPKNPRGDYVSARELDFPRVPVPSVSGVQEPTRTRSVVFHAIRDWGWLDRLSLTYNYSTNFEPSTSARNFQGEAPSPATGVTEDIGIGFSLLEGKLNGRVSRYTGGQKSARAGGIANGVASRMNSIWNHLADTVDESYRDRVTFNADTAETRDEDVDGYEMNLTYNPTKNWRIAASASRNDTARANQSPSARKYMADNFPFLLENFADVEIPTQSNRTVRELIDIMNENAEIESLNDGLQAAQLRPWKFSILTNYNITSGSFKGFGFGGFVNWQDKALIGYGRTDPPALLIDRNLPYWGDDIFNTGIHLNYTRKIFGDRATWKVQLNVRNLLNEKYVSIAATEAVDTDNLPVVTAYRMQEPRSVTLTNTFSF